MSEKPKRDTNPPTLDFVTALTIAECVQRLKDAAFSSVNTNLTIRANEQQFVIEDGTQAGLIGQLTGYFSADAHGTRVMCWTVAWRDFRNNNMDSCTIALSASVFGVLGVLTALMELAQGNWLIAAASITGGVLAFGAARYFYDSYSFTQRRTQDNLALWVQQLFEFDQ
jgi:hypothetical protein